MEVPSVAVLSSHWQGRPILFSLVYTVSVHCRLQITLELARGTGSVSVTVPSGRRLRIGTIGSYIFIYLYIYIFIYTYDSRVRRFRLGSRNVRRREVEHQCKFRPYIGTPGWPNIQAELGSEIKQHILLEQIIINRLNWWIHETWRPFENGRRILYSRIIGLAPIRQHESYTQAWVNLGAVHKVRHARGEGVREDVTVCDRGKGPRACDVTLLNFFILHIKPEI